MTLETVDTFGDDDVDDLRALYASYEWWAGRTREDVARAVEHTDLLVGLRDADADALVAAGRVLTDFVYYAKVYDVIVAEGRRREGLGERLMVDIVEHPALAEVDVLTLNCREGLVPFYERCGFERHPMCVEVDDRTEGYRMMVYEG